MKKNKQFILLIICFIIAISLLIYGIYFAIKHKNDGEVLGSGKINVNYSAGDQLDVLTQPSPKENIVLKTLPDTNGTLTEINFNTLKKLFQTTKKSILTVEKDDCSYCESFEPKFIEALDDNGVTAYKINISKLNTNELTNLYNYVNFEGTPTTYIIENGKVSHSFKGNTDKETISAFVEYFYVRSN